MDWNPEDLGAQCSKCFLRDLRDGLPVAPEIKQNARFLIIGEAPGQDEVNLGRPFCLVPETKILYSDLTWRDLGEAQIGDEIYSVDEECASGYGISGATLRRWKLAKITRVVRSVRPTLRIVTDDGELTGSEDHLVLGATFHKTQGWRRLDQLICGEKHASHILSIGRPWTRRENFDAGWLGGLFDGEGHVNGSKRKKHRRLAGTIGFSQNAGPVLDRALQLIHSFGYSTVEQTKSRFKENVCYRVTIGGGVISAMRFLGEFNPVRLVRDFRTAIESGSGTTRGAKRSRVRLIESVGNRDVVDITTTSGTFIANGFIVHNCGKSGMELDRGLRACGVDRSEVSIDNALSCRPPDNKLDVVMRAWADENKRRLKDSEPMLPSPFDCCRPRLLEVIRFHERDGKVNILTLGKQGVSAITQGAFSILDARGGPINGVLDAEGTLFRYEDEAKAEAACAARREEAPALQVRLLPTLHPAFVLRMRRWTKAFRVDLGRATRWFGPGLDWVDPIVHWNPPVAFVKEFLARMRQRGYASCDIECAPEIPPPPGKKPKDDDYDPLTDRLRCIGFSDDKEGFVVHFLSVDEQTLYYNEEDYAAIFDEIAAFLLDPEVLKIGHNFLYYDSTVLKRLIGAFPHPVRDTLTVHKSVESELPHRLAYVGSVYSDTPSWKEGDTAKTSRDDHGLGTYCLKYGTQVRLADGTTKAIEEIVAKKLSDDVLSLGGVGIEAKPIVGWHANLMQEEQHWIEIETAQRRLLRVTSDHPIWVEGQWIPAGEIHPGQMLSIMEKQIAPTMLQAILGTCLGDSSLVVPPSQRDQSVWSTAAVSGGHSVASGLAQAKIAVLGNLVAKTRQGQPKTTYAGTGPFLAFTLAGKHQFAQGAFALLKKRDAGKRIVVPEVLDALGPAGLAWWFMDDGCRQVKPEGQSEIVKLAVHRYWNKSEIAAWFDSRYGGVYEDGQGSLCWNVNAAKRFVEEIAPFVFPKMRYKFGRIAAPKYTGYPSPELSLPAKTQVVRAEEYRSHPSDYCDNSRRLRMRYCIDVADNHNFFTSAGLVHNCVRDCVVVDRVWPKIEEIAAYKRQTGVIEKDHQVTEICRGMHENGLYVNQEKRQWHDVELLKDAQKWLARIRSLLEKDGLGAFAKEYNPGSALDVRELLFEKWGLMPPASLDPKKARTKSGLFSTGDDVLLAFRMENVISREKLAVIEAHRRFRRAVKLRGTYVLKPRSKYESYIIDPFAYDTGDDGDLSEDAEAQEFFGDRIDKDRKRHGLTLRDGRLHPDYKLGANTGRLSSSKYNALNLQMKMRDMFEPAPGNVFVYADMDQIQLRIIAWFAQAVGYLKVFNDGGDAHAVTAEAIFRDKWLALQKGTPDWESMRGFAKSFSYAVAFGAQIETILAVLRSTEDDNGNLTYASLDLGEAQSRYDAFLEKIPLRAWWESEMDMYRKNGGWMADPLWGRRRDFADGEDRNAILCYRTQSSEAAIMHEAGFEICNFIPFGKWGPGTGMVNQNYDSIIVECPASQADYTKGVIEHAMNRTADGFGVKFTSKAKIVHSWYEPICKNRECVVNGKQSKAKLNWSGWGYRCPLCGKEGT